MRNCQLEVWENSRKYGMQTKILCGNNLEISWELIEEEITIRDNQQTARQLHLQMALFLTRTAYQGHVTTT